MIDLNQGKDLLEEYEYMIKQYENTLKRSEIKFKLYESRETYDILLPNDIIQIILNIVCKISSSLVSYQFYIVNQIFVSKCYHLHHFIPKIKNLKDKKDKSPKIIVIHFNGLYEKKINYYQFNNITYDITNKNVNLLEFITKLSFNDPYVKAKYISVTEKILIFYDNNNIYDYMMNINYLKTIDDDIISQMVNLICLFKQNIIDKTADLTLLCDTLIDLMPEKIIALEVLNKISYQFKNLPFYVLLLQIVTSPECLTMIYDYILNISYKDLYDLMIKLKNELLHSFIVDDNSLFLYCEYKKPPNQLYTTLPEHQWFFNQL